MKLLAVSFLCLVATLSIAQPQVSQYEEQLRAQNARTQAISNELLEMIRQDETDREVIASVGRRFLSEVDRAIQVTETYKNAITRFGLQSEIDHFMDMYLAIGKGRNALTTLMSDDEPVPYTPAQVQEAQQVVDAEILELIEALVEMVITAQGAADYLADSALEEAIAIIVAEVRADVRRRVEAELSRIVGTKISLDMSIRDHIRTQAETWVNRKVNGLVVRLTSSSFVVEAFAVARMVGTAVRIIEWVGPKLREALRNRGNLDARTDRALSGMRAREVALHSAEGYEDLRNVRQLVEAAEMHIEANNYLRGDIRNAGREDLAARLAEGEASLERAMQLTRTRFLMSTPLSQDMFAELLTQLNEVREDIHALLSEVEVEVGRGLPEGKVHTYTGEVFWTDGRHYSYDTDENLERGIGLFKVELVTKGPRTPVVGRGHLSGVIQVRVIDPNGRVILNSDFQLEHPGDAQRGDRGFNYNARDLTWVDGTDRA